MESNGAATVSREEADTFLGEVASLHGREHTGIGMGTTRRFNGDAVSAASLEVAGRSIHVAAFPRASFTDDFGDEGAHAADRVVSRIRRR